MCDPLIIKTIPEPCNRDIVIPIEGGAILNTRNESINVIVAVQAGVEEVAKKESLEKTFARLEVDNIVDHPNENEDISIVNLDDTQYNTEDSEYTGNS